MKRLYVWCCRGCHRYFDTPVKGTHPVYCAPCDPDGARAARFRAGLDA